MKLNNNSTIQRYNNYKSRGFTLIELLVAISIIGILSSFLLANFVGVRQRARDGVRKSDLRQIQSALEMYRADKAEYPDLTDASNRNLLCASSFTDGGTPPVIYMQKFPCDPLNTNQFKYKYMRTDLNTYALYACLENVKDFQADANQPGGFNLDLICDGTTGWSYTLQNP